MGDQDLVLTWDGTLSWRTFTVEFVASGATMIRLASESPTGFTPDGCNGCWEAVGCGLDNISLIEIACPGDVISNGIVDGADLSALLSVWGTSGGLYPRADCNGDGLVDGQDLAIVLGGWGACP